MRSRAICRLQEPARWVPEALLAMPLTPWARHLNLRGRPRRLQIPAHEKPIEAGTLPTFIDTPTATAKQKQKPEGKFVTLLSDAKQPTKRQRQEEIPREQCQPGLSDSSSSCAADTPMHVPETQRPILACYLSPEEREDSIQKRQRPAETRSHLGQRTNKPYTLQSSRSFSTWTSSVS